VRGRLQDEPQRPGVEPEVVRAVDEQTPVTSFARVLSPSSRATSYPCQRDAAHPSFANPPQELAGGAGGLDPVLHSVSHQVRCVDPPK